MDCHMLGIMVEIKKSMKKLGILDIPFEGLKNTAPEKKHANSNTFNRHLGKSREKLLESIWCVSDTGQDRDYPGFRSYTTFNGLCYLIKTCVYTYSV